MMHSQGMHLLGLCGLFGLFQLLCILPGAIGLRTKQTYEAPQQWRPRLRVLSFDTSKSWKAFYLLRTAEANGLHVEMLGREDFKQNFAWGQNMGQKANAVRSFLNSKVQDNELVLFVDAWDVMVLGNEEEIWERYDALRKATNRTVFFNAEMGCDPVDERWCPVEERAGNEYLQSRGLDGRASPGHRFLNSGAWIALGRAAKQMLDLSEIPNKLENDQIWFHQTFAKSLEPGGPGADLLALDRDCAMFQTSFDGEMGYPAMKGLDFLEPSKGDETGGGSGRTLQLRNQGGIGGCPKGARPVVLHFQGSSKWLRPRSEGDEASSLYADLKKVQKATDPASFLKGTLDLVGSAGSHKAGKRALGQFRKTPGTTSTLHEYFEKLLPAEAQFIRPFAQQKLNGRMRRCEACKSSEGENGASPERCRLIGDSCSEKDHLEVMLHPLSSVQR